MQPTRSFTASLLGVAFLGGLCGALALSMFMGTTSVAEESPQVQPVIRAEPLEIVDTQGQVRAALGTLPTGATGLAMYDQDHNTTLQLGIASDGRRALGIYDKHHKLRLHLNLTPDGQAQIRLLSGQNKNHITLSQLSETEPKIEITNGQGKVTWSAP